MCSNHHDLLEMAVIESLPLCQKHIYRLYEILPILHYGLSYNLGLCGSEPLVWGTHSGAPIRK
jgi:hypothetical protein